MFHGTYSEMETRRPEETVSIDSFEEEATKHMTTTYRRTRTWPYTGETDHLYDVTLQYDGEDYPLAVKTEERDDMLEVSVFQYDPMPRYDGEPAAFDAFTIIDGQVPALEFAETGDDIHPEETVEQAVQAVLAGS